MSRLSLNSSSSSSIQSNNSNNSIPNGHNNQAQPASQQQQQQPPHNPTSNSITSNANQQQQQQITGSPLDQPADCTIACEEGHLTAHKLVLCDHSKYLQDILSKFPTAEHPIIILTELNIVDIKILVNYMYTGELVITSDSSPTSLLRAAQILKIDSLTEEEEDEEEEIEQQQQQHRPQLVDQHQADRDMDEMEADEQEEQQQQQQHHHHHQQQRPQQPHQVWQDNQDPDDDELDERDLDDEQDPDDDMLDDDPIDDPSANDCRLINSVYNIYSLNQFINPTTPPSPPMQLQHHHHHNNNHHHHHHLQHHQINNNNTTSINQESKLDKNNKIRCHLCNIGLSDVKCLYRHVLTRHLPEKWGYKCEFCDREFSRDDHLMRHYTTKHKNMEFNREKIRETRRLNREMAKNFHDQISVDILAGTSNKL